jgi:hypothetical protein
VRNRFLEMKDKELARADDAAIPWFIVDSKQTIEELHTQILKIAEDIVQNVKANPVRKLWM